MTSNDTLKLWESLAQLGSDNMIRIFGTTWTWSVNPEVMKNGARRGVVHSQKPGDVMREIGAFKTAPNGRIERAPAEFIKALQVLGFSQTAGLTPIAAREARLQMAFVTDDIEASS